jgi:hypothetical protein
MSTPAAAPAPSVLSAFAPSAARRRRDRAARGVIAGFTVLALVPLVLIVYYLLEKGLGSWSGSFFTTDPTGASFFKNVSIGGIKSAILGTIEMVAIASSSTAARACSRTSCASSSTCSPASRRSSSACSSTSRW